MGQYQIELSVKAQKDLAQIKKRGSKIDMNKIVKLLEELENHPKEGIGLPKPLRNQGNSDVWSRRLNQKDRVVYEIIDHKVLVLVISFIGHYDDK
ncbi:MULTISPECIES: Txe/YoeB family addiction module toxin [Sphingobacterium]|uniref:Txe/YoeB family addiction module toxin n=1 Tax=Sphingobacterium TaxID=28453 RepID=UPI00257F3B6E|nr:MULTISPECIES: Txe/YoeB family addiction module toxin [Sphingobacterium]